MQFRDVLDNDLCSGCGLCTSMLGPDRATMAPDERGFARPVLKGALTQEEDRRIGAVCPGGRLEMDDPQHRPVWGPILSSLAGHATDPDVRFRSSSGGVLSGLLAHLIDSGEVDYVLHIDADGDRPWSNRSATSASAREAAARAGSRYAPSSPLTDLVQRLDDDRRFAVVGKPCDVAALRAYARQDPRVDERIPVILTFMCGGVPSEAGARELLHRMQVRAEDVEEFRYRGHGWPGRATAKLRDGSERSLSYAETWGEVLSNHVQRRCKICPDGLGAFADIVCADAWFLQQDGSGPAFDERPGRSLVLARSERGRGVVQRAEAAGALELTPFPLEDLERIQPHQARRTRLTPSRLAAMQVMGRKVPEYEGLKLAEAARQAGVRANIRSFAGAVRRVAAGRL